ncbi:MAG: hypothetical protein Q9162_005626 [Coniocarpon cinnabarinum]
MSAVGSSRSSADDSRPTSLDEKNINGNKGFQEQKRHGVEPSHDAGQSPEPSHKSPENGQPEDLEKGAHANEREKDSNIVDFEGDDDQLNAQNWPAKKKWSLVGLLAAMTFVTTSLLLAGFVVSVYVLGYASGPLVAAPLSELYGRQWVYAISNVFFVIFSIACAVATSLNMLIGFRFLAGIAGSTVIAIGGGTVADLFVQEERGKAMSLWSLGPLIGPVAGPVAGGFLSQAAGWRWVFWLCTIAAGAVTVLFLIFNKETYAPVLLERKAKRLRKETGNPHLRSRMDSGLTPAAAFRRAIVRPLKMLVFKPIVLFLAVYVAVVYGYLYLLFTTLTEVFQESYHWKTGIAGLSFLGIGIGNFVGVFTFAVGSDRNLKKRKARGEQLKPEHRLPLLVPAGLCVPIGFFIYGWSAEYHVHWFVPIFGTFFVGVALMCIFMPIQTYLVDAFTVHASSAIAANTVLRSIVGAVLPLAGQPMYAKLGLGWGNSLLGFISLTMIPIPLVLIKYGERIRLSTRFKVNL